MAKHFPHTKKRCAACKRDVEITSFCVAKQARFCAECWDDLAIVLKEVDDISQPGRTAGGGHRVIRSTKGLS